MATRVKRPNGHKWIQFKDLNGARQTIRLGKMPAKSADVIKGRVEALMSARLLGCLPDEETARWITKLPPQLAAKLASVGLIEKRLASTVGELNEYCKEHLTCKSKTAKNEHRYTREHLAGFFGNDRQLHTITKAEAKKFYSSLQELLAPSTAGKRCEKAKGYFNTAVDNRWLLENPFDEISTAVKAPRDRDAEVCNDTSKRILDEITDPKFRLVYAFARYAGLRTPSEINALVWEHVRWSDNQILIDSSKNGQRIIPIFRELRPYLEVVFDLADANPRVLGEWHPKGQALTNRLKRVLKRLGITPWPKPWQNLRATRENELLEQYPQHVVHAWIGHTEQVAREHYHRVVKEHFSRAAGEATAEVASTREGVHFAKGEGEISSVHVSQT